MGAGHLDLSSRPGGNGSICQILLSLRAQGLHCGERTCDGGISGRRSISVLGGFADVEDIEDRGNSSPLYRVLPDDSDVVTKRSLCSQWTRVASGGVEPEAIPTYPASDEGPEGR